MKKAVIYVRVRVPNNAQEAIDKQLAVCTQFAKAFGYEVVGTYIDNDEFKKRVKRVSLSQLKKDCRKATWDTVITYTADRISRDINKLFDFEDLLEKYGKSLLFADAPRDAEYIQLLREIRKSLKARGNRK